MQLNTKNQSGFTIIELLITLAVLGIVTSISIPAMDLGVSEDVAVRNSVQNLRSGISLARSQAIESSVPTRLCATASNVSVTCGSGKSWSNFWLVMRTDTGEVLARSEVSGDAVIKLDSNNAVNFNSRGFTAAEKFKVSADGASESLCIELWATGTLDSVSSC